MIILTAKTMISLHSKTKGILKAKTPEEKNRQWIKTKISLTGPAKKEQALGRNEIMAGYTMALCQRSVLGLPFSPAFRTWANSVTRPDGSVRIRWPQLTNQDKDKFPGGVCPRSSYTTKGHM